jgi:hypothetical protein
MGETGRERPFFSSLQPLNYPTQKPKARLTFPFLGTCNVVTLKLPGLFFFGPGTT